MLSAQSQHAASAAADPRPSPSPQFSQPAVTWECSLEMLAAVGVQQTITAEGLSYSDAVG